MDRMTRATLGMAQENTVGAKRRLSGHDAAADPPAKKKPAPAASSASGVTTGVTVAMVRHNDQATRTCHLSHPHVPRPHSTCIQCRATLIERLDWTAFCIVPQDCEDWDAVAAETGWTLEHCLAHKLAFKRKDDPKVKAEAMAAHMRRLRAAGRHLLSLTRSWVVLLATTRVHHMHSTGSMG